MSDAFRKKVKDWLTLKGYSRSELAKEAGYTRIYLNSILSQKPITVKAERNLKAAMKRMEEDPPEDSDMITIQLSAKSLEKIKKAAEILKMNIDQFIEAFLPPEE